jgi:diguanylate cyclase (GGDEF)-like protein
VATIAYFFGRRQAVQASSGQVPSRRELRRAQAVAHELEEISELIRKHLTKHRAALSRFKQRVNRLSDEDRDEAMQHLFREAEEMIQPTIQLAGQIANAYDQIRQQTNRLMTFTDARTDPLTGVNNRRALDEALGAQLALKARYNVGFSVAMFDIDHFKQVNDRQGHLYGDRVLQDVAQIIDENARETDTVVRYGGEEFVVVMPETDMAGASHSSERIRRDVAERLSVTVSGGVTHALDGDTLESVVARADAALYEAKEKGRDRVYRHDGELVESVVEPVPAGHV